MTGRASGNPPSATMSRSSCLVASPAPKAPVRMSRSITANPLTCTESTIRTASLSSAPPGRVRAARIPASTARSWPGISRDSVDSGMSSAHGGIDYQLIQVTLLGDVSIHRHRREPEGPRHSLHRDRIEPLVVRDLHGRLDDPLMTQLALRSSLRRRSYSLSLRDHPRHF